MENIDIIININEEIEIEYTLFNNIICKHTLYPGVDYTVSKILNKYVIQNDINNNHSIIIPEEVFPMLMERIRNSNINSILNE